MHNTKDCNRSGKEYQGMTDDGNWVRPRMSILVDTSPFCWGITCYVKPDWTIKRVLFEIRKRLNGDDNQFEIRKRLNGDDNHFEIRKRLNGDDNHLESLEKMCMLLFKGKDLMERPSSTIQELGIEAGEKLIICDKRPFSIKVSMQNKKTVDVKIKLQDTVGSLKQKIQEIVCVPVEKQRLCYVDLPILKHVLLSENSIPLVDFGIARMWSDSEASRHQICLHTDDDRGLEEALCSPVDVVASSSSCSCLEIVVQYYSDQERGYQLFKFPVRSCYTVNQLMTIIRDTIRHTNYMDRYLDENCFLLFQGKNLLDHGSSTLGELGIKDQDKLLIPEKEPFSLTISLSSSSIGQDQETRRKDLGIEVEAGWSILNLKGKIERRTKIPVKKQRLCGLRNGLYDDNYHEVMSDDTVSLASYDMGGAYEIGLWSKEYHPMGKMDDRLNVSSRKRKLSLISTDK